MPAHQKKEDDKGIRVVAQRREEIDRDMLSVALFGWIVDRLRREKEGAQPRQSTDTPTQPAREDGSSA
jgi:hypothetical protein